MGRAYYNENDPYAAQWLRNLIAAGLIAPGYVDDRSITEVRPDDLRGYAQCHFFAGIAGWSRALRLAGWADDRPVWTGSCPCQPFSVAGKRKGFDDSRHLWPVWFDLIKVCRPPVILGEQVAAASSWLGLVRGDLEGMGYAVGAIPIEAASAGADHLRDRLWFVADRDGAAIRDEPGRSGWQDGAGSAIDGDDCQGGDLGFADGDGRQPGQSAAASARYGHSAIAAGRPGVALGDARGPGLSLPECEALFGAGWREEGRTASEPGGACALGNGSRLSEREPHDEGDALSNGGQARPISGGAGYHLEWVIGADGKARRTLAGICLLAHGVPARVGKLRAFGNAIDPRPAAAFITAAFPDLARAA